ncbi:MAG: hypothetical protein WAS54_06080 [Scrofimicrobium sp.]
MTRGASQRPIPRPKPPEALRSCGEGVLASSVEDALVEELKGFTVVSDPVSVAEALERSGLHLDPALVASWLFDLSGNRTPDLPDNGVES